VPRDGVPVDVFPDTPPRPRRAGFTLEGSLGLGVTRVAGGDDAEHFIGLSGLNVGIGGFIGPQTALTLRIAGGTFSSDRFGPELRYTTGFGGPAVQHYVTDRLFVGGGLGLGVFANSRSEEADEVDGGAETGFALDLRAGYDILSGARGALHVAFEMIPVFLDDGTVTSMGFQVGAQLF
jgi:hypothetical protein